MLLFAVCPKPQKVPKDVFTLLFRLYEKVTKRDVFLFFLLLQKEPKSSREGCDPPDSRGAVQNPCGGIIDKIWKVQHIKIFCESLLVPQNARPCFEPVRKGSRSADARTRQKLPVASFGVSETAETGSIVSGREQDDHVSRRLSLNIRILTLVG